MEFNASPPQFKVQGRSGSAAFQVSAFSLQPSAFSLRPSPSAVRRKTQAGPLMVRAYHNVRATGGAVFFPLRGENTRERWSPFKVEGDGGCSKKEVRWMM